MDMRRIVPIRSKPARVHPSDESSNSAAEHQSASERPAYPLAHSPATQRPAYPPAHSPATQRPAYPPAHSPATQRPAYPLARSLKQAIKVIIPALLASLLVNVFVAQAMVVEGPSMRPNLNYDQRVIVEKVTYGLIHGPRRGDVVIINRPEEKVLLVKRAVALAGETVAVRDGQVFINGQPLEEAWSVRRGGPDYPPTRVPAGHIFVLGDNREESRDSRFFGPVPIEQIGGQVKFIVWPLDQIGPIRS
jgi:signal peptidase I